MKPWRDIKTEAISLNVNRTHAGMTADEMLERVRRLIADEGYKASGPTKVDDGYEFRTADGAHCLVYMADRNVWE